MTTTRTRTTGATLALALTWAWALQLMAGCAAAVDEAELAEGEVAVSEQAVLNGTRVALDLLPDSGTVRISAAGGCTGTLITNRWVLTADHCFCQSHVNSPGSVSVSIYGTLDGVTDAMRSHHTTVATKVIRHPTLDVALVKLKQSLPYSWPARIYTGSGGDLIGQTARIRGFGDNRRNASNVPIGLHESQYWGEMRINRTGSFDHNEIHKCPNPAENFEGKPYPGLEVVPIAPANSTVTFGDSGSGLFVGSFEQAFLVGVAAAGNSTTSTAYYTGMWLVRDWIKQVTDIWTLNECLTQLPSSASADRQAIATGPDGKLHAVAVFPDTSIGHWSSTNGKSWSWLGWVPNGWTANTPALTTEAAAPAWPQPKKLGLAFRNPSNNVLMYARWNIASGWEAAQAIPSGLQVKGGLAGHNGIIAFAGLDDRAGLTAFDAPTNTWLPVQWARTTAPRVDTARGISVAHDQTAGLSLLGYRTTNNAWVQTYGSWSCAPTTGSYLCNNEQPYGTDWVHAAVAYVPGERIYIETVRQNGGARIEQRTVLGAASYDWGWSNFVLGNSVAVTDFKGEVYALRSNFNNNGLAIGPVGNCYNSQF